MIRIFTMLTLVALSSKVAIPTAEAQIMVSPNNIIGKWKLISNWVNKENGPSYMPMEEIGVVVYEFNEDGTYINFQSNNTRGADTVFVFGRWELFENGKQLHLFQSISKSVGIDNYNLPDRKINIVSQEGDELRLNDSWYDELDTTTERLYVSLYIRVK